MAAFKLTEIHRDLFYTPKSYSLAYSCTADFYAERNTLAWSFWNIFGAVDKVQRQHIHSGNVAVLEDGGRYIYHLITKDNIYQKATYQNLEAALICMRHHMKNYGDMKVAMPRLCCGKDGLKWSRVKDIILRVFANEYNSEIIICNYHPEKVLIPKCRIVEHQGHEKTPPNNCSVVHAISADFAMCPNMAMSSKCRFDQSHELLHQDHHTGGVAVLKDANRFVYNLVTKERNHEKSTYVALFYALIATRDHMREHGVRKLALPRLGCGIERLEWPRVKAILEMVFANDNIEIATYVYGTRNISPGRGKFNLHCDTCKRAFYRY